MIYRQLKLIVTSILLFTTIIFIWKSIILIFFPYSLEHAEGEILQFALLVTKGKNLYPQLSLHNPFIGCNYPPLYIFISSLLFKIFYPGLVWGRIISFLSIMAIGLIIYKICRSLKTTKFSALTATMVFYSLPLVNSFATIFRPHVLSVCLSVSGFYLTIPRNDIDNEHYGRLSISELSGILLMVLGTGVKQTAVFVPMAYIIFSFFHYQKEKTYIVRFIILLLITSAIHLGLTAYYGINYLNWVIFYASGKYYFINFVGYMIVFLKKNFLLISPALLFSISLILHRNNSTKWSIKTISHRHSYFILYFIIISFSLLLLSKNGSSIAYFYEFFVLCSIWVGLIVNKIFHSTSKIKFSIILPVLFIIILIAHIIVNKDVIYNSNSKNLAGINNRDKIVLKILDNIPGILISEDPLYVYKLRKPIYLVNPFIYSELSKKGLWTYDQIIKDIDTGKISAFCINSPIDHPSLLTSDRFGKVLLLEFQKQFKHHIRIGNRFLYSKQPFIY